jgi:CRP/FNR family transcriptional regulator
MNVKEFYIFKDLSAELAKVLEVKISKRRYEKGSIIFYSGECSQNLHMLNKGMVKLYKHNSHDEELVLHYFKNQSLLGEMATFQEIPYPANAVAETSCEIWTIKKEDFVALLEATPHMALEIITSMGLKIKMLENSIDLNISKNSMQRVVSLILNNIEIFGELSRVKISGILNMTPETLSRRIQVLKQEGAIEVSGKKIIVLERALLKKYLN